MKRTELIGKLLKEGFSEKTLVNFTDKQLNDLSERIVTTTQAMASNPEIQKLANDPNKTVEVKEILKGKQNKIDKNKNGKIDADDFAILNKEKKGEVKEGIFGGKHKKGETIKHGGHEIDVFSKGDEKVYGHPRKEGSKNQNDKERLVYSDLDGLKKSIGSMSKGEKNVNFPKSKKINNPDYKSTVVDINEVDMGLTIKGSKSSSSSVFGGSPKKSSSPKKKSTPKKKEEGETEEGEVDESLNGLMLGVIKNKLSKDLGREPEDHEIDKAHEDFVNSWKKENESKEKEDKEPTKKKKDVDELLRFYDDDGNPIKNKKGEQDAVSTKDKNFKKKTKSKKCSDCGKDTKDCKCDHSRLDENRNIKNWVKGLVENKEFHSFTSKNEIMELIQSKLNESETMVQHGPKVKKGHNGIPEFMSYDAIVSAEPKTAPSKPAPSTKPGTRPTPTRREDPRKTPFQPGPGTNPKPKAKIAEEKKK